MKKTNWEYEKAENEKGVWFVFPGLCKGCGLCMEKCPVQCITWSDELGVYGTPSVLADINKCVVCGICQSVCPDCAIRIEKNKKKHN